jgi:hypothetical protein
VINLQNVKYNERCNMGKKLLDIMIEKIDFKIDDNYLK